MNPRPPEPAPDPEEPHRFALGPSGAPKRIVQREPYREEREMKEGNGNAFGKQIAIGLALFFVAQSALFLPAWGNAMARLDALQGEVKELRVEMKKNSDTMLGHEWRIRALEQGK